MFRCGTILCCYVLGLPLAAARGPAQPASAQSAPASKSASADFSQEPQVVEKYYTTARFENDGTGERDVEARIKVQTDAAAQKLAELVFSYSSPDEKIEVRSVTVYRPDGSNATAPLDAAKDTAAAAIQNTPAYGDYREVRIPTPALHPGDTLEYRIAIRIIKPFALGEFWFQHTFSRDAIVLDERLELNLPQGREVTLKSPTFSVTAGKEERPATAKETDSIFSRADENGRTVLRWQHSNLTLPAQDNQQEAQEHERPPDVQLTTFKSWTDVARWYAQLERGRNEPTPEIRTKAEELLKGGATDLEKMQALYDYVAKNIAEVELSFGLGGFQPHTAAEIFKNWYADPKDKNMLLASMLEVAGIHADAALLPRVRKLDTAVPSPAQFDYVVTAVPEAGGAIWMDATSSVAPFRFLAAPLRDKSVLLVASDGDGKIATTPADPPFLSAQRVEIDGSVTALGKLSGTVRYSLRGDTEFVLRTAFRRTPAEQWNQLGQTILTLDGLHGEVSSVKTSDPSDTQKPFELTIEFSQPNFFDWSTKQIRVALPLLTIGMPDPPSDKNQPVEIGSPLDVSTHLTLRLPPAFTAQAPIGMAVTRDYAVFKSSYRFENGSLVADRSLNFKMRRVSADRIADYLAFTHAVESDENQALAIENTAPGAPSIPASATAEDVFEAGATALQRGNARSAIPLLQRATELDPKHKQAWSALGIAYMRAGNFDGAAAAFRKQLEVNPSDAHANDYLGLALQQQQRYDEAAAAFRSQIELDPLDAVAHASLGTILLEQHQDSDAVPELEKATILSPKNASLELSLGRAYLNTGATDKALDAYKKAVALSPTPFMWNNAAYDLADRGVALDDALQYADLAVKATEASLANIEASRIAPNDLAQVENIAAYWDTLGWIYFKRGDLPKAERYLQSAWVLGQPAETADHLAQLYEKSGAKDRAIHEYALALAAPHPLAETRARLMLLLGGNAQIEDLVRKAAPELDQMRRFEIKQAAKENASADFLVVLSPSGRDGTSTKVNAVRFLSGSESLRPFEHSLETLDYGAMFPGESRVKLVRRGTLSCSAASGCAFTLATAEATSPAN